MVHERMTDAAGRFCVRCGQTLANCSGVAPWVMPKLNPPERLRYLGRAVPRLLWRDPRQRRWYAAWASHDAALAQLPRALSGRQAFAEVIELERIYAMDDPHFRA